MSDYLDYLAARSLNLISGIQPRLPGLFEPPQGIDAMGWMDAMPEVETPDSEPAAYVQQAPWLPHTPADPGTELPSWDGIASVSSETSTHSPQKAIPSSEDLLQRSQKTDSSLAPMPARRQNEKESVIASTTAPLDPVSAPQASVLLGKPARRDSSFPARSSSDEILTNLADQAGSTLSALQASEQSAPGSVGPPASGPLAPIAAHNDPARLDRSDQRADAFLDSLSSEGLPEISPPAESRLPVVPTSGQTKRETSRPIDPVSSSKASAVLRRSPRRDDRFSLPPSDNLAQPSHPEEAELPVIQTSQRRSASQPEVRPLDPIASMEAPVLVEVPVRQENSDLTPLPARRSPTISPAQPEGDPDESHPPVSRSPEQEGPAAQSFPSPGWVETKLILEAARAQARVPSVEVGQKQPGAAHASSKSLPAQRDRIQRAVLPATSTESQDQASLAFENLTETIKAGSLSSPPTGGITVRPTIQPARPSPSGMSSISLSSAVSQAEAPPDPVVHVNIGRIEVRATPQAQTKREPQSKLPALGLDEYLKQFGGKP